MKFERKVKLGCDEIFRHSINREAVFKALCIEFRKRYPDCKLQYAYINPNKFDRLQMLLIFTFSGKVGNQASTKYLIHIANLGSPLCLQGFDLCKSRGWTDQWFADFMDTPVVYPEKFFADIINRSDDLTFTKTKDHPERYWKDPKNAKALIAHLDSYAASFYHSLPRK